MLEEIKTKKKDRKWLITKKQEEILNEINLII